MRVEAVQREGTYTVKLDEAVKKFGSDDLLPLWVADMDIASPLCVQEALQKRAAHPVYGYTVYPDRYFDAIQVWYLKRFGWRIEREWIVPAYGVVPSLNFAIHAYSREGDSIIVQTPLYPPFSGSVRRQGRQVLDNQLIYQNGSYAIDFADFEAKAKEAKLFLLCSPHNPTGRVWEREELEKMIDICLENEVVIVSDEIHADIVYKKMHHVLGSFAKVAQHSVVLNAPSKTFNIAGLNSSYAIIPNRKLRHAYIHEQNRSGITNGTPFGIEALMAAYEGGEGWLDELKVALWENVVFVKSFITAHDLPFRVVEPEATFLVWIDCRGLGLSSEELAAFFINKAKLGLNEGVSFGKAGEGFMRLNIGTSKEVLHKAMQQLLRAYEELK
ncbi:MalY/PatB family protein [Sulfurovum mangrovi]|uniref:MalY/PatB family protein n=1 Tax=Sulfurovum mangrovi TaxID=2893889 RepID=UPI001E650AB5|nr:PatB family C-S lyase [Sulfurovum mangrovi]UFH59597.1 PatB family C-S lyase [Sulfurovum mangrovi]UFH60733.1 PatB family C-S lyase [Sulfurovum mangrovi]